MKMPCSRCRECQERGDRFCIYCGEYLTEKTAEVCTRCDECRANGDSFCRYCGKRLVEDENIFLKIGFVVGMVTAVILSIMLLFEYGVAIWGIPQVLPNLPDYGSTLILVVPVIVNVVSFDGVLSQIYYILLFLAVTISILIMFIKAYKPILALENGDDKSVRETAFFEVPVLFAVLFFWELVFVLILQGFGVELDTLPDMDTWKWMYELLEASVWEEVITRILIIGLPMALIALMMRHKGKDSWKYLFGGFGFSRTAMVLIVFSAVIFGAGHLNNWGWWKFFPTFAFGLIAGYLFCKYGVYATILLHFMTDYMTAESWVNGTDASVMTALFILLTALACVPYTYIYIKKGVLALRDLFLDQSNGLR